MTIEVSHGGLQVAMNYLQHFGRDDAPLRVMVSQGAMVLQVGEGRFVGRYVLPIEQSFTINCSLPLHVVAGIARECQDVQVVRFDLDPVRQCRIEAGSAFYRVNPLLQKRQQQVEQELPGSVVDVDGLLLLKACKLVSHAVARGEVKAIALKGLLIDISIERFSVVGCDGRRLSALEKRRRARQEGEPELSTGKSIVHREHIGALLAAMETENPELTLRFFASHMEILSGRRWASFPAIDGHYPQWRKTIRRNMESASPETINCLAGPLKAAIRQLEVFSTDEASSTCLLSHEGGKVFLECAEDETGQARVELACDASGWFEPVLFSAKIVREAIAQLDYEEKIRWEIRPQSLPMLIASGRYRTYVMPMAKSDEVSQQGEAVASA